MRTLAKPLRYQRAYDQGFKYGAAGDFNASPPYIVTKLAERLIREWLEGYRAGLQEHARGIEKARL